MKHTKGPWLRYSGTGQAICGLEGEIKVANVCTPATNLGPKSKLEFEANARLIAAAPELLELCIHVLSVIDVKDSNEPWAKDLVKKLKAMIKKAGD